MMGHDDKRGGFLCVEDGEYLCDEQCSGCKVIEERERSGIPPEDGWLPGMPKLRPSVAASSIEAREMELLAHQANLVGKIARLEEELEQERDIRSTREITLSLVADGLGVEHEPHQTFDERLLEASCTPSATRENDPVRAFPDCVKCGLEAKALLHQFCKHADCPVRK